MIPSWWLFVVLALGAARLTRLAGWDDLPPIVRLRGWIVGEKAVTRGSTNARMGVTSEQVEQSYTYRWPGLAHFLSCSFCSGFWFATLVYGGWLVAGSPGALHYHSWLFYALVPFALSEAVGLVSKNLDP